MLTYDIFVPTGAGSNNDREVSELKTEVGQLKDKLQVRRDAHSVHYVPGVVYHHVDVSHIFCRLLMMQEMSSNIDRLTSLVNDLMLDKMNRESKSESPKRKKHNRNNNEEEEAGSLSIKTDDVKAGGIDTFNGSSSHSWLEGSNSAMWSAEDGVDMNGMSLPPAEIGVFDRNGVTHMMDFDPSLEDDDDLPSLDSTDIDAFLQSLSDEVASGAMVGSDVTPPDVPATTPPTASKEGGSEGVLLTAALEQNLQSLTPELQQKLVETLVAMGAGQDPTSSSSSSSSQRSGTCSPPPPIVLPLASAALGAFLTRYAHSQRTTSETSKPVPPAGQPAARKEVRSQA